jgi:hypothetical protein
MAGQIYAPGNAYLNIPYIDLLTRPDPVKFRSLMVYVVDHENLAFVASRLRRN